jgi:hypothetical protein
VITRQGSCGLFDLEWHDVQASVEAAELFAVTRLELEQVSHGLTTGGLQAFKFQGLDGREARGMGLLIGRNFVFGPEGTRPPAQASARAYIHYLSVDRGQPDAGALEADTSETPAVLPPCASGRSEMNRSCAYGQRSVRQRHSASRCRNSLENKQPLVPHCSPQKASLSQVTTPELRQVDRLHLPDSAASKGVAECSFIRVAAGVGLTRFCVAEVKQQSLGTLLPRASSHPGSTAAVAGCRTPPRPQQLPVWPPYGCGRRRHPPTRALRSQKNSPPQHGPSHSPDASRGTVTRVLAAHPGSSTRLWAATVALKDHSRRCKPPAHGHGER